jgi:hypothetical protein
MYVDYAALYCDPAPVDGKVRVNVRGTVYLPIEQYADLFDGSSKLHVTLMISKVEE